MNLYHKHMLRARLIEHEGYRNFPYKDSTGHISIGIGHNLDAHGLTDAQIHTVFELDITVAESEAAEFPWFSKLSVVRQSVMIELMFNLGLTKVLKFKKMLAAMEAGEYGTAAHELVDSLWCQQVGSERCTHLANILATGKYK